MLHVTICKILNSPQVTSAEQETNQNCDGGDDEAEVVCQVFVVPGLALNKKSGPCELSCHGCQTEYSCCQPKIAYLLRHDLQFPLQCCTFSAIHHRGFVMQWHQTCGMQGVTSSSMTPLEPDKYPPSYYPAYERTQQCQYKLLPEASFDIGWRLRKGAQDAPLCGVLAHPCDKHAAIALQDLGSAEHYG